MCSTLVTLRLNSDEATMLDAISKSKDRGDMNRSEMLRLLIRREFSRRTQGTSKVAPSEYSSEFRNGRPRRPQPKPMIHSFLMAEAKAECARTNDL